jgi:hypothetical protein
MRNNETRDKKVAAVVYACFLAIWLAICLLLWCCGLCTTPWVWIPFGAGIAYLAFTGVHASRWPLIKEPDKERGLLKWISQYLTAFVLAITIVMLVGLELAGASAKVIRNTPELSAFYRFEFLALGFVLLFVFPTYWFGGKKEEKWLPLTRHLKTAGYLSAVFFCLAGIVELATYLSITG